MADTSDVDLRRLGTSVNKHGVDSVLVGGPATLFRGASRPTADADLVIDMADENLDRFLMYAANELDAESILGSDDNTN